MLIAEFIANESGDKGTFSQRHAILTDQNSDRLHAPLQSLTSRPIGKEGKAGTFEVVNSPLSEYAVVGFEQGVGWVSPNILPMWEAQVSLDCSRCTLLKLSGPDQFGDFHNTAQVILDTFLGGGESKWGM